MYFTIKEETIEITFTPNIAVSVKGPDTMYYIEVREYLKNMTSSRYVQGYMIDSSGQFFPRSSFNLDIEFYGDFEISVYKFIENIGVIRIFSHRYNDYGQNVLFNLNTNSAQECEIWFGRILEYQKNHGCNIQINSNFKSLNEKFPAKLDSEIYKIYNIGRFLKTSTDAKTVYTRKDGLIWFGNWKTFWSYQHPRDWKSLSSKEIIDDILGF